ncbi:MAG: choice-of-anchor V domain-containing protein [Pyrinomonadaceae bacterium]
MNSRIRTARWAAFGFVLTIFTFAIFLSPYQIQKVHAEANVAPGGETGAPGEGDCTDCHSQNTRTGQFLITPPANYTPGATYTVEVRHTTTDTSRRRWGFEMTALTASNTPAGTFASTDANTSAFTDAGRRYVSQTSTGTFRTQTGGAVWTFNWTAPTTNVGPVTFYASGLQANNANGDSGDQTYLANMTIQTAPVAVPNHDFSDFDGDGRADPTVFRPSSGNWYVRNSTAGNSVIHWGAGGDEVAPADFDGDNKTDIAVWRPGAAAEAAFYILQSATNTIRIEQFGITGDDPFVVADWDGDGKADPAVYRDSAQGSQSFFYYIGSLNNPNGNITFLPWGTTGDRPLKGDFDGDGKNDLAVFRPSNGIWYILRSSTSALQAERWGLSGDTFVSGDFDGDSKTDPTVFRNGVWYVKRSSDNLVTYINWGTSGDIPTAADFDGDGKTDAAIYRNGVWWILESSTSALKIDQFGLASDIAATGFSATQ